MFPRPTFLLLLSCRLVANSTLISSSYIFLT
uniref:Uncharacterized protein n=1 Tax=Arundo donax TaxID=35708 RepID=A0A0A9C3N5_ARUDO